MSKISEAAFYLNLPLNRIYIIYGSDVFYRVCENFFEAALIIHELKNNFVLEEGVWFPSVWVKQTYPGLRKVPDKNHILVEIPLSDITHSTN